MFFLETQKYLANNSLEKLHDEFNIDFITSYDGRLLLNYSQFASSKFHPIVKECRSLCLNKEDYNIISRGFLRFFNLGEDVEGQRSFDWKNSWCQQKLDGSYISLFYHNNEWKINTRGSFAYGIIKEYGGTWTNLFEETLGYKLNKIKDLDTSYTYVFELCSRWNQTVVYYPKPELYLLSIFSNKANYEYPIKSLAQVASYLRVKTPELFPFNDVESVKNYIDSVGLKGSEFEGFVFRDINNNRIKLKLNSYLQLHRLSGNSNICLLKNLIPYIVNSSPDLDEARLYLRNVQDRYIEIKPKVDKIKEDAHRLWNEVKGTIDKKEFALRVKNTDYASLMFEIYKIKDFEKVWKTMSDFIYKKFFSNKE